MSWHIPLESYPAAVRENRLKDPETRAISFETFAELEKALDGVDRADTRMVLQSPLPAGENVEGERLRLISSHMSFFQTSPALHALDLVGDPLASKEDFVATMVEMPAAEYGDLIRDGAYNDVDSTFRVYAAGYFIENLEGGHHGLMFPREYVSTIKDGVTLEELEQRLFDFAREERGFEITPLRQNADAPDGP